MPSLSSPLMIIDGDDDDGVCFAHEQASSRGDLTWEKGTAPAPQTLISPKDDDDDAQ